MNGPIRTPASRYPTSGEIPSCWVISPQISAAESPAVSVRIRSKPCGMEERSYRSRGSRVLEVLGVLEVQSVERPELERWISQL